MNINSDLSRPATVDSESLAWVPSPLRGVDRRMLERDGGEVARATSIVRYAPNSSFSAHSHALGEEFLVLSGTFSDESGDFPQGMYVRNPPGSQHTPSSKDGCVIFVKLRQMSTDDQCYVRIDTNDESLWRTSGVGQLELLLFEGFGERVRMLRLDQGASYSAALPAGGELYVVEGQIEDGQGSRMKGAWQRQPAGSFFRIHAVEDSHLYLKTGHLG